MKEITTDFAIEYLLDDCENCPENENGECMTQSHCFEVKQMAIKALRMMDRAENGKMLICPECGLDFHSDYRKCPRCGAKVR